MSTADLLPVSSSRFQNVSVPNSPVIGEIFFIPEEIVKLIGTFLDTVSLVAFAFTCKNFKQINAPFLPKFKFCEKAAELGYLELIRWGIDQQCRWTARASAHVAKWGYLPVLQWAWDQGCLGFEPAAVGAAAGGHADVLEWLYQEKGAVPNANHAHAAASQGHIELFQALKSKLGDKYVKTSAGEAIHPESIRALMKSENLTALEALLGELDADKLKKTIYEWLDLAAEVGNLKCLKFLLNRNIGEPDYTSIVNRAASHGRIQILEYIFLELHKNDAFNEKTVASALSNNKWDVVRWLIAQNIKGNENASYCAARDNRAKELELILDAGWPMHKDVCACAAAYGDWDLVNLLIGKGLAWEEYLLYFCAAKQGRIDLLNDIKAKKVTIATPSSELDWFFFPFRYGDYDTSAYREHFLAIGAALGGQLEALHWVEEQGFKWKHELVAIVAVHGGHLEVLQWLFQRNCPYESEQLYRAAVFQEHIRLIEWMIEFPLKTSNSSVSAVAAKSGKGELLKKLVEQGCPVNSFTIGLAAAAGHWDIVDWFKETDCGGNEDLLEAAAAQGKERILSFYFHQYIQRAASERRPFNPKLMLTLAKHGYWKIFRDVITGCVSKGSTNVLRFVKERGYGFDVEAVTRAAYTRAKHGDQRVLNWLKENHYLT